MLHAMQEDELLISREELAEGRVRRLYRATERGREELQACRQALAELAGELLPADLTGMTDSTAYATMRP
jgi:DNA-binding PadR family transcriptional regulator